MDKIIEADIKGFMEEDISNRLVARLSQLLSKYDNKIGISYTTLDKSKDHTKNIDYSSIPENMIDKVSLVNQIEYATRSSVTSVEDFLRGEVNSYLCRGVRIEFKDDPKNFRQTIELIKHHG
ncbi:MAG: hypothetical protein ACRCX2_06280 [Paraclostridium sp.]